MNGRRAQTPACDVCHEPLAADAGVISIDIRAAGEHLEHRRRVLAERDGMLWFPNDAALVLGGERWLWSHPHCLPEGLRYEIPGHRLQDEAQALAWTLQLMGKQWFDPMHWEGLLRRFFHLTLAA